MSHEMKRVIMLVARSDEYETFVVGAWEDVVLDTLDQETYEAEIAAMKEKWWPHGTEWREVPILIDSEKLLNAFATEDIVAEIE